MKGYLSATNSLSLAFLLSVSAAGIAADPSGPRKSTSIYLTANDLSVATGEPSLVIMSSGSTHIPVWSLSGGTEGQSVAGVVDALPVDCFAVRVEIVVTTTDKTTSPEFTDVYRVHLSQLVEDAPFNGRYALGKPVETSLPAGPFHSRNIVLETHYEVDPKAPLWLRIQREPGLEGDTFTRPTGLAVVKVTPQDLPPNPKVVQDVSGYNSWPMIQSLGETLVCTYSRGSRHNITEDARAVYARTSSDGGKTWTEETVVADTPGFGEVTVGKGLDSTGAMLLWVRRIGTGKWDHDLYRTTDGVQFDLVTTPELEVDPMQITDVFSVPGVGLMSLWFAGNYSEEAVHSWGTVTSEDDGKTWKQTSIETGLTKMDWPTEPAAVSLGEGRIFAIARTESSGQSQFQMISTDFGKTWKRTRTNISDIRASTPSLVLDPETGLLSNYYYERGRGILRRRVIDPAKVFDDPLGWPASEVVALASKVAYDAGNANATVIGDTHYISFYSGEAPDTTVMVSSVAAP